MNPNYPQTNKNKNTYNNFGNTNEYYNYNYPNYPNQVNMLQNSFQNISFNTSARNYIPNNKSFNNFPENNSQQENIKLNLNLEAKEYISNKKNTDNNQYKKNEEFDYIPETELDMRVNELIQNEVYDQYEDEDEPDVEKWFPKYKECECCKGFIYKCNGIACLNMGICYCKMKDECGLSEY